MTGGQKVVRQVYSDDGVPFLEKIAQVGATRGQALCSQSLTEARRSRPDPEKFLKLACLTWELLSARQWDCELLAALGGLSWFCFRFQRQHSSSCITSGLASYVFNLMAKHPKSVSSPAGAPCDERECACTRSRPLRIPTGILKFSFTTVFFCIFALFLTCNMI